MLDALPKKVFKNESAVINLDKTSGDGTHWVCFRKNGNKIAYFDSYGNLPPPLELVKYWGNKNVDIFYNYHRKQRLLYNCGHLCLKFLYNST